MPNPRLSTWLTGGCSLSVARWKTHITASRISAGNESRTNVTGHSRAQSMLSNDQYSGLATLWRQWRRQLLQLTRCSCLPVAAALPQTTPSAAATVAASSHNRIRCVSLYACFTTKQRRRCFASSNVVPGATVQCSCRPNRPTAYIDSARRSNGSRLLLLPLASIADPEVRVLAIIQLVRGISVTWPADFASSSS